MNKTRTHVFIFTNKIFSVSYELLSGEDYLSWIQINELYVVGDILERITLSEARITEQKLKEIIYKEAQGK